ncbi:MAG: CRISPR-associated protein Cas4 [Pyrobaculum sp.]
MELLLPKPLCDVVNCHDLDLSVEGALAELRREQEVFKLLPDVYAYRYDFKRLSPSVINDYEYCPRLLWTQYKLGLKLLTKKSLVSLVKGRVLHERYERALSVYNNVITEYKIEIGDLVGVVDLVIRRGGKNIPVEIKTGTASKQAHKYQLQIYISMLGAEYGYLVYRNRIERVHRDNSALLLLHRIKEVLSGDKPPAQRCEKCEFKAICKYI